MDVSGTLELNANFSAQQNVYEFNHVDKIKESWRIEKKQPAANVMKTDQPDEQTQKTIQR